MLVSTLSDRSLAFNCTEFDAQIQKIDAAVTDVVGAIYGRVPGVGDLEQSMYVVDESNKDNIINETAVKESISAERDVDVVVEAF